jgi:hypothetical protein
MLYGFMDEIAPGTGLTGDSSMMTPRPGDSNDFRPGLQMTPTGGPADSDTFSHGDDPGSTPDLADSGDNNSVLPQGQVRPIPIELELWIVSQAGKFQIKPSKALYFARILFSTETLLPEFALTVIKCIARLVRSPDTRRDAFLCPQSQTC